MIMNNIDSFLNSVGVIDTETTGTTENDDIIQLSIMIRLQMTKENSYYTSLYKPGIPVPPESSAVHFLSDDDVKDAPTFAQEAESVSIVIDTFKYLIAHNAEFDRQMLANNFGRHYGNIPSNVLNKTNWICTLVIAKKLYGQDFDNFSNMTLGYLWFKLGLYKTSDHKVKPHDAQDDVYMCYKLLEHMIDECINRGIIDPNGNIGEQLHKFSTTPNILEYYPYGKYRGVKFSEVANKDRRYLEWMVKTSDLLNENHPSCDLDFAETIVYYLS